MSRKTNKFLSVLGIVTLLGAPVAFIDSNNIVESTTKQVDQEYSVEKIEYSDSYETTSEFVEIVSFEESNNKEKDEKPWYLTPTAIGSFVGIAAFLIIVIEYAKWESKKRKLLRMFSNNSLKRFHKYINYEEGDKYTAPKYYDIRISSLASVSTVREMVRFFDLEHDRYESVSPILQNRLNKRLNNLDKIESFYEIRELSSALIAELKKEYVLTKQILKDLELEIDTKIGKLKNKEINRTRFETLMNELKILELEEKYEEKINKVLYRLAEIKETSKNAKALEFFANKISRKYGEERALVEEAARNKSDQKFRASIQRQIERETEIAESKGFKSRSHMLSAKKRLSKAKERDRIARKQERYAQLQAREQEVAKREAIYQAKLDAKDQERLNRIIAEEQRKERIRIEKARVKAMRLKEAEKEAARRKEAYEAKRAIEAAKLKEYNELVQARAEARGKVRQAKEEAKLRIEEAKQQQRIETGQAELEKLRDDFKKAKADLARRVKQAKLEESQSTLDKQASAIDARNKELVKYQVELKKITSENKKNELSSINKLVVKARQQDLKSLVRGDILEEKNFTSASTIASKQKSLDRKISRINKSIDAINNQIDQNILDQETYNAELKKDTMQNKQDVKDIIALESKHTSSMEKTRIQAKKDIIEQEKLAESHARLEEMNSRMEENRKIAEERAILDKTSERLKAEREAALEEQRALIQEHKDIIKDSSNRKIQKRINESNRIKARAKAKAEAEIAREKARLARERKILEKRKIEAKKLAEYNQLVLEKSIKRGAIQQAKEEEKRKWLAEEAKLDKAHAAKIAKEKAAREKFRADKKSKANKAREKQLAKQKEIYRLKAEMEIKSIAEQARLDNERMERNLIASEKAAKAKIAKEKAKKAEKQAAEKAKENAKKAKRAKITKEIRAKEALIAKEKAQQIKEDKAALRKRKSALASKLKKEEAKITKAKKQTKQPKSVNASERSKKLRETAKQKKEIQKQLDKINKKKK